MNGFIRYADDFVEVPGGKNMNNYEYGFDYRDCMKKRGRLAG